MLTSPNIQPLATDDGVLAGLAQELTDVLGRSHTLLKDLLELAGEKLALLRKADSAALLRCAAREGVLLQQTFGAEQQRKAILARLAQRLRRPGLEKARVTEIAEEFPEPQRSALRARSLGLREVAENLEKKNRTAATVARNLQSHVRGVLSEMARTDSTPAVYGPRGQRELGGSQNWVDAVG